MESGTLSDHPPSEILRGLASLRATGCLRLEQGETSASVHFRDGLVYTAAAPAARARLGDRLVGAGHVTEEQLAGTLALQRSLAEPRRIGEILIERGLIDRETMRTYVREQIADSVAATLRWTHGEWIFTEGEEVAEDAPLDMSVENLLMEAARRLEEWGVIEARLGSVDTVVDFDPDGSASELSLTPDEWSMLTRIDGASSIAEIAEEAGYGQFEAARIIYGLLTAGVVTVVVASDDPTTPGEAEPQPGEGWDPAEWTPDEGESRPPPAGQTAGVDRNELLREFAALDDEFESAPAPPPPSPPRPAPRKGADPPPRPEPEDRRGGRGLFRRRRD
jgi:hypothetical protein